MIEEKFEYMPGDLVIADGVGYGTITKMMENSMVEVEERDSKKIYVVHKDKVRVIFASRQK